MVLQSQVRFPNITTLSRETHLGCKLGAFSGLLAFAISFMSGTRGLLGWSWIFVSGLVLYQVIIFPNMISSQIIEGMATVVVGILAFFGQFSVTS